MTFDRHGRGPRMLGMMGIVLASGMAFTALKEPAPFGALAVNISAIAALSVATLGAILCTPRAFWAGFAVVGWASFLVGCELWIPPEFGTMLPSAAVLQTLTPETIKQYETFQFIGGIPLDRPPNDSIALYRQIAHPLLAILQGLAGGLVALLLARRGANDRTMAARIGPASMAMAACLLLIGLGVGALRFPLTITPAFALQSVYVVLFGALLAAVSGPRKAFWIGFALAGWGLLLVEVGYWPFRAASDSLVRMAVRHVYGTLYPQVEAEDWVTDLFGTDAMSDGWSLLLGGPPGHFRRGLSPRAPRWPTGLVRWNLLESTPHYRRFQFVAVHLACLLLGIGGGLSAVGLVRLRRVGNSISTPDEGHRP